MKGIRGALGVALGLALMQLVLSTSQSGGKSAALLGGAFTYPAKWVRDIVNPETPALPDLSGTPASVAGYTTPGTGLSGTGTAAGTGSSLLQV